MPDESLRQALRAAIRADPQDDAPWLIYADFLDDNGEDGAAYRRPRRTDTFGIEFVFVLGGTYWMSQGGVHAQRQAEIAQDFQLGAFPVTQGQWQALMGKNPGWFSRTGDGKDRVKSISEADLKQFPVEHVSWNDVQRFLKKLNAKNKESEWVYRLPTEAEWEYACRGAVTSQIDCSFNYYIGDTPSNVLAVRDANFSRSNIRRPSRVGSYRPNRLGLYDTHGNVQEWVQDADGSNRVVRGGGCWVFHSSVCTAAFRSSLAPTSRYNSLGFRLARSRL